MRKKISLCPKHVEKIAKEALVSQAWPQKEAEAVGASAEVPNDLMEIQARAYELEDCYWAPLHAWRAGAAPARQACKGARSETWNADIPKFEIKRFYDNGIKIAMEGAIIKSCLSTNTLGQSIWTHYSRFVNMGPQKNRVQNMGRKK